MKYTLEYLADVAKFWLENQVYTRTTWKDFQCGESTRADEMDNSIIFWFSCTYTWKLNSWDKNMSKEIGVIYIKEKDSWTCTEAALAE